MQGPSLQAWLVLLWQLNFIAHSRFNPQQGSKFVQYRVVWSCCNYSNQGWQRHSGELSSASLLAPHAKMSDSSSLLLGASGLVRSTRLLQAGSAEFQHLHCPKQTSWADQHCKLMPPICWLSKHRQASQWSLLQDQACCWSLCGCANEQTSYATQRRWNDFGQNKHPHSCQVRMPGLHVYLIPCIRWHLCSIGPHCFVLKNSGHFLVCLVPIQLKKILVCLVPIHLKKIVAQYFFSTARIGTISCSVDLYAWSRRSSDSR